VIGIVLAILLRNYDPYTAEKKYSWEDDEDEDDVSIFDDES
jgi:hypothetical protein